MEEIKMKKRMLITTIVMLLVVAVALTSSSLAWFAVDGATSVSATGMSFTAGTSEAGGDLKIEDEGSWGVTKNMNMTGSDLLPMIPVRANLLDNDDPASANGFAFNSGNFYYDTNGEPMFTAADDSVAPVKETFTVANFSETQDIESLKFTVTMTADETLNEGANLCIAIVDSAKVIVGVWSIKANVFYGEIVDDTTTGITSTLTRTANGGDVVLSRDTGKLALHDTGAAYATQTYTVLAWFDGADLRASNDLSAYTVAISVAINS